MLPGTTIISILGRLVTVIHQSANLTSHKRPARPGLCERGSLDRCLVVFPQPAMKHPTHAET